MSDSKKTSSPYVVLENRPLDHWKVTELKEELKKRKLGIKGLKEELVKRLDEAVRVEIDEAKRNIENDLNSEAQPEVQSDDGTIVPIVAEKTTDIMDQSGGENKDNVIEELDNENTDSRDVQTGIDIVQSDEGLQPVAEKMVTEGESCIHSTHVESLQVVQEISAETTVLANEGTIIKELEGQELRTDESQNTNEVLNEQPQNGELESESQSPKEKQAKPGPSDLSSGNKVVEVSQVHFDSVSIDTISNTEKSELKDNVIADNVKLDLDVKPDMVQPLFTNLVLDGSKSESVEVDEPHKDKAPVEEKAVNYAESVDVSKENNSLTADDVKLELDVKPDMAQPLFTNVVVDDSKSESVEVDEPHKDKAPVEDKVINYAESADVCKENNSLTADDVKLELDVKPEKVQPSFQSDSVEVEEPHKDKVTAEEKYVNNAESVDISKNNDSGDAGSSEKLNLDRSSGDDSMEEDALESKRINSKFSSNEVGERSEKIKVPLVKEDQSVDVMVEDVTAHKNFGSFEDKAGPSVTFTKRKPHDQEASENSETVKRQRRWNSEGVKVPKQQITNNSATTTLKDAFQAPAKHTFSRSDSTVCQESPKERVVPPLTKPSTTSLRIDNFLRPFTLKAVQELLGKTGTVVSFWMDNIKTHCYVTYASVEEAIESRNGVYNLQWPVNGGRLLVADFVDPQEVKSRVDAPATPVSITVPPPPPPSAMAALPEKEKIEGPVVTLDDLFRKTRATPRIYYLPLSEEQVAAAKQSAGLAFWKEQLEPRRSCFWEPKTNLDLELSMLTFSFEPIKLFVFLMDVIVTFQLLKPTDTQVSKVFDGEIVRFVLYRTNNIVGERCTYPIELCKYWFRWRENV